MFYARCISAPAAIDFMMVLFCHKMHFSTDVQKMAVINQKRWKRESASRSALYDRFLFPHPQPRQDVVRVQKVQDRYGRNGQQDADCAEHSPARR